MNGVASDGGLLEHLQAEHHRLNCTLSAIQHRINDLLLSEPQEHPLGGFFASLNSLRAELLAHFAEEEIDGCLGEAAIRCPSAAAQLKAIAADHESLFQSVNEFIASLAGERGDAEAIASRFQALSERLHAHEVAETRLLQYALGGDVADYDVEGND
jgi:hypothetical protein